jgi:hypothetical protein
MGQNKNKEERRILMEQFETAKDCIMDTCLKELRKSRGEPLSLEYLREKAFGKNENLWECVCQRLVVANIVRKIRQEFGIYIFSMYIDGHRGYIVIEKKEDFEFIIEKTVTVINGYKMKLDKMKRDTNSSQYRKNVEKFFKGQ